MRILWFSNTPAAGDDFFSSKSTGGWLKSLDKAIQDKVELHIAFYNRHYPAEFKVGETSYYQIGPYDKLSLIKRRLSLMMGNNPDIPRYLDIIKRVKPDLIHIHGTEQSFIQLTKHTKVPVLLSIQAILTVLNHKYFAGITQSELPYFARNYISSYNKYLKQAKIERDYLPYVKYVLGRTDWDRRVYSVLAPHANYFVSNEILRDGFYNNCWKEIKREDQKTIIHTTTGGLLFKGFETTCMALQLLNKIGIDVEWRVAGLDESCKMVKVVKRKLGRDYPNKGLVLLGSLPEDVLIAKMLEAHIFVYPTHQDNSSNALCEAMIMGMPCISTFAGGSSTMLKNGIEGVMIQDGDPWAMAGAIIELVKNRERAIQYGQMARKTAMHRHSKDIITQSLFDIYQQITNNMPTSYSS